ncbi:MAG: prepilin peptidase [Nitrososphaerales archaeon]
MLVFISYLDLKKREVPDKVWIIFGLAGIFLHLVGFSQGESMSLHLLWPIGLTALIAYGLYFLGFYGGADAKALITLSVILPYYEPSFYFHRFASLITLTNGIIITLSLPFFFLIYNSLKLLRGERIFEGFEDESKIRKFLALCLGFRSKKVRKFMFPLEKEEEGKRRFEFKLFGWYDEYTMAKDKWITPAIPLLIFISAGYLSMILFGDIIFFLMSRIFLGT